MYPGTTAFMAKREQPVSPGSERRACRRYRVRSGALAFIDHVPGSIVDISERGIGLHYLVIDQLPGHVFHLDIFLETEDLAITGVPARLVRTADGDGDVLDATGGVRRLGIEFGELSAEQERRIKYFILHNTVHGV